MDKMVICDRCGSDACYVQEVNEEIKNYQCYGCGFITNSLLKQGSQFFEEQMELLLKSKMMRKKNIQSHIKRENIISIEWIWKHLKNFLKMII